MYEIWNGFKGIVIWSLTEIWRDSGINPLFLFGLGMMFTGLWMVCYPS